MFLAELYAIRHSKRSRLTILAIIVGTFFAEGLSWYDTFIRFASGHLTTNQIPHPAMVAALSFSSSGQGIQMLLTLLLPVFLILISTGRTIERSSASSNYPLYLKAGKLKRALLESEWAQFRIVTLFFLLLYSSDFLIAVALFHGGENFRGLADQPIGSSLLRWELIHPYLTYVGTIIVVSVTFGIFSTVLHVLALNLKRTGLIYLISMVIWLLLFSLPHGVAYFIQPFVGYNWHNRLLAMLSFGSVCGILILIGNLALNCRSRYW
ncbi:hypothetical protein [Lentilactobacillus farraginis]|uniref:hypothetical protein n=1 Tax=Lentilactobacillus farraginis TaxID=390841 RepID=UPI0009EC95C8|nr:hypothetical protein [Lentilactobacillus farraginis]